VSKVPKVGEEKKTEYRMKSRNIGIMECWNAGEEQRQIAE
jgi:hypothetical protein